MNSIRSGYRLFCWPWWKHWFDPTTYYYWLKYKIQRAQRGWADCDTWSLDHYLTEWLPDALLHLKNTKHGTPMQMFDENAVNEPRNPTKAEHDKARIRWDAVMDKMIEAFKAHGRIDDVNDYEKELGPWPECPCCEWLCNCAAHREDLYAYMDKMKPLIERDQQIFKEGMALFTEHFGSLWD